MSFVMVTVCSAQNSVPTLSDLPVSPLSPKDIDGLLADDSPKAWKEYADKTLKTAISLAEKDEQFAGWIYVHKAAELFAKEGAALPEEVKKAMLSDIPALCDFFESVKKEDNIESACKILERLHSIYPDKFKKYIRSAYAVALVYDVPPPGSWPMCNTISDPTAISLPEEAFNIFLEKPEAAFFPLDKLTVGELVWVFGVGGPIDELRELRKSDITPSAIERLAQSIKTDKSRLEKGGKTKPWDESERPFNPQNILKYGGSDFEKIYCAWRIANANAIPCLFFTENGAGGTYAWLSYMAHPGNWKSDVARPREAKLLFGRPLDPQTWKTSRQFDIDMLAKRRITTQAGINSAVFLRLSEMYYENGKYAKAIAYAEKSFTENPENWEAYIAHISAHARYGTPQAQLDIFWKKAIESFRSHPDMCIQMLNYFRENLIALRRGKEADKLLSTEMRAVMRTDPGLGIDIYSNQIADMFARAENKAEVLVQYQDIVRNSSSCLDECFKKIVTPLARLYYRNEDYVSAQKTISIFASIARRDDSFKHKIESLKESVAAPKKTKREKTAL